MNTVDSHYIHKLDLYYISGHPASLSLALPLSDSALSLFPMLSMSCRSLNMMSSGLDADVGDGGPPLEQLDDDARLFPIIFMFKMLRYCCIYHNFCLGFMLQKNWVNM